MHTFLTGLIAGIPLLPLLAGLAARGCRPGPAGWLAASGVAWALALTLVAAGGLHRYGPLTLRFAPPDLPFLAVSLRFDLIAAIMAGLVCFLGLTVVRFSRTYLAGDPRQAAFLSWLSLTIASVLALVMAGSLTLMLVAWIATSLCLHRLLLHHPERAGAVFAARKKFVVSRLGDLCLLAALVLTFRHYGTGDLETLFAAAAGGDTAPLPGIGLLLAACAALKSAQFPFHSWLSDTMETPTPVSAFMHAGIINAGGFLVVRLSPLFVHAPAALTLLAVLGATTAAFGAIVMLTQPSVKRALAYSTIAQMGFMLLQCGLGAFGLALLHLVAHSLYKAHAFLRAGSTIGAVPRAAVPLPSRLLALGTLAGGLLVAGVATLLTTILPNSAPSPGILAVVLALALAYGLARVWSAGGGLRTASGGLAVALGITLAGLTLHAGALALFADLPRHAAPPAVIAGVAGVFVTLFIFQCVLWRTGHSAFGRSLYVYALNGFYVGTVANRILGRLWPRATP